MIKILPEILFSILLSSVMLSAFNIQLVKAAETIYINVDGSISPPDAPISSFDNITYTLTGNITGSIVVERSNIIVDGKGYTVEGYETGNGFTLQNMVNVTVKDTRIEGCFDGIQLFDSTNCIITGNCIVGNSYEGIGLYYSSDNIVTANSIANNQVGIGFYDSSGNLMFHNSFANNAYQAYIEEASVNVWDNGSNGNYWSNYTDVDSDGDGIGDTPHVIDVNNTDNYPLMKPWTNIAILDVSPSKTVVGKGFELYIYVSVQNQGWNTETTNITAHAYTENITTFMNIALTSKNSLILTFTWDTADFAKGNYTIGAIAEPVPGETDTEDNEKEDGWVVVTIPGDASGDGKVGTMDLSMLGQAWDTSEEDPNNELQGTTWNPLCDFNNDLKIGTSDLSTMGKNWGKTDP